MKTTFIGLTAIVVMFFAAQSTSAQFTISVPKLPKMKRSEPKTNPQPTVTTTQPSEASTTSDTNESTPEPKAADCSHWWVQMQMKDMKATRAEAEEFRPGLRDYYVSDLSDRKNRFMEAALSPMERKEWFDDAKLDEATRKCMDGPLDDLATVARKTLPSYTGPAGYTLGTPAEKKALLEAVDTTGAKVLRVGLQQASWLIAKDDNNFPTARYKHGMLLARYPSNDTGFCWLYWVNLKQDYAGGGTYGDSYGYFVSRSVSGCPAK